MCNLLSKVADAAITVLTKMPFILVRLFFFPLPDSVGYTGLLNKISCISKKEYFCLFTSTAMPVRGEVSFSSHYCRRTTSSEVT